MPIWICRTCGVEQADANTPPVVCAICSDERQYVPAAGQTWTTLEELSAAGTHVTIETVEPRLFGVRANPIVGIGQRTHLIQTDAGNVLWDPIGYVDATGAAAVLELGPVAAIVASHPHHFGAQVAWSRALGGVPVLVADADRRWVQRPDAAIEYIGAEDLEVVPGVTIRTIGGHFAGSKIAIWADGANGRGVVFSGDTLFPTQDGKWVGFMRSYPNNIPLSGAVVDRIATTTLASPFDRLYGNFGWAIPSDAHGAIHRSAARHVAWVRGDFDDLT
ncbi:hydrolase [Leifsonia sp. A12D58]|uniref:hydrolase n=1 Tax=Leifsonia sp. A12D58 TaxID=3397674 RepID=UPI0039E1F15D